MCRISLLRMALFSGSLLIGDLIERRAFSPRKLGSILFDVEKSKDFGKYTAHKTTQAIIVDSTWYQSNKGIFLTQLDYFLSQSTYSVMFSLLQSFLRF